MTKKHFEWAAAYVRDNYPATDERRASVMAALGELFAAHNPRFNLSQFYAACRGENYTNPANGRTSHYDK
jgi:hypothetical protein